MPLFEQSVWQSLQSAFQCLHWKPQTGPKSPAYLSMPMLFRNSLELFPAQMLMFFFSSSVASVEPLINHISYSATPLQNTFLCVSKGKVLLRSYRMRPPNKLFVPVFVRSILSSPFQMISLIAFRYWYYSCSGSANRFSEGFAYFCWLWQRRQSNLNWFYRKVLETQEQSRWSYFGAKTSQGTSSATKVSQTYLQSAKDSQNTLAPPITKARPCGSSDYDRLRASCKLRACFTCQFSSTLLFLEMTMLRRLGSALWFMDSNVFFPMMTVLPCWEEVVIFLNIFISVGSFQGSLLALPMPPERVLAMTRSKGIWRVVMSYQKLKIIQLILAGYLLSVMYWLDESKRGVWEGQRV